MSDEDYPLITELWSTTPKAHKEYKCDTCRAAIAKGMKYKRWVYRDDEDGKIKVMREHWGACLWELEQL